MNDIVFIGDWIKVKELGSGSFGTVVLWRNKNNDEKLAIKTCKWGDELNSRQRDRWTKEVEMLQNCSHPNIVGTKELPPGFVEGLAPANLSKLPILCMEYYRGGDLRQLLNKPESCAGLKETDVRQILNDIGNALQFLHLHKITHRDLKPENIVMNILDNPQTNGIQIPPKVIYKLIDLGYAKEIDSKSIVASFVGTLPYLAPELLYSKTYSNSVDYWSFGLLVFEITCGVRPFLPYFSPVQWMPHVKQKNHEVICVYESFHSDIVHSTELFPENYVSKSFKSLLEKWLQVALEWDPKLRGRDSPSKVTFNLPSEQKESASNVVIFNVLEKILTTKIIKIFSVTTVTNLSYEIDETTTIGTLKSWLFRDVNMPIQEQILISQTTYIDIGNDELVVKYWTEKSNFMVFLYNKNCIIKDGVGPIVPEAVQRCLEHQNTKYNYKNSQTLYRQSLFFVMSQMEIFDALVKGLYTRGESLKHESKQLLLKHNTIDKDIGKLVTQEETIMKMIETGKQHIQSMRDNRTGTNFLGGFQQIFDDADNISSKINKLQTAWSQLSVRLQSAARRSNEVVTVDLNTFVAKHNYQSIYTNAMTAYVNYKVKDCHSEARSKDKQCQDIKKICYNCLKFSCNLITEMQKQPFVLKLQDLNIEFAKISDIIANAAENRDKLGADLAKVAEELSNCTWVTLSMLARDADNLADIPYSVVSFQKRDFKIGESVSNHCIPGANNKEEDMIKSLVLESVKIRQNHKSLSKKISTHKNTFTNSIDFSFLNDE